MKRIIFILPLIFLMYSCTKVQEKKVTYIATEAISGFDINYRTADGTVVMKSVETASAEDRWDYEFMAEEGDIVFVSAIYSDISSAITIQILIDGKVYKQGSSNQDTVSYVTISGTVPFN